MLIVSDLHLHTFKAFNDKSAEMNTRLRATANVLKQILKYADEHEVGRIVFVGDVFETKNVIEAHTNNILHHFVFKCRSREIDCIFIPGNHDISSTSDETITLLNQFSYLENCVVCKEPTILDNAMFGGLANCICIPFRRNVSTIPGIIKKQVEMLKNSKFRTDECYNLLFYHGAVLGAKISNREFLDTRHAISHEDLMPDFFDYVFLGHFHKHQKVGVSNVKYVGSPLQHDMNDAGDKKGFYHLDMRMGKLSFVPTEYPKFIQLEIKDKSELDSINVLDTENYYHIKVKCPDVTREMLQYNSHNVKVTFDVLKNNLKRINIDLPDNGETFNITETLKEYIDIKYTGDLDKSELLSMGMKFLEEK